jgi:protein ImuB
VDYQTACLRLPQFPLQLLLHQKPEWRDERVVWLEQLKADARVRYLSAQAAAAGVYAGARYATILGVVPDLLAGTSELEDLGRADQQIVEHLRKFSPQIRRRSQHLEQGLYLLDASGLGKAFKGYKRWATELVHSLRQLGWDSRLAVGFTPFATEMATYHLQSQRPIRLFQNRRQEERRTLQTSLTAFSLSPEQISRLRKFNIRSLGDFLLLEPEEVKRRFGGDLLEFYQKASEAIFAAFPPLPEPEPTVAQFGFGHPVADLTVLLQSIRKLLQQLLPLVLNREEAVATLRLEFVTEDGGNRQQILRPTYPTADLNWLMSLVKLRLEKHFRECPLKWGCRVERLVVEVTGEADPEKQGDLFTDWALDTDGTGDEVLTPRDKEAGLWALSQVRAEFGEQTLVRARLLDHHLPDRDHLWVTEKESLDWLSAWHKKGKKRDEVLPSPEQDKRVRRIVYQSVGISRREDWSAQYGPYSVNGGWWGDSFVREYSFCQKEEQTAWLYEDAHNNGRLRVQGWLQ